MSNSTIPIFLTEEEAVKVFQDLESYTVRLEKDPTIMGPSYVHDKLKACRDFSNKVETLLISYYDKDRRIRNMLASKKAEYDAKKAEMLATDPVVDKKRSADGRAAYVDFKLKEVIEEVTDLKEQLTTCQMIMKSVELRKDGLNRANNDIKKQVSLMEFAHGKSGFLAGEVDFEEGFGYSGESHEGVLAGLEEDDDVAALFATPATPPIEVSEAVAVHLVRAEDPNPKTDFSVEGVDDLDGFLDSITTEPEALEVAVQVQTNAIDDDEDLSTLFSSPAPDKFVDPPEVVDDEVVDIGAFLMQR